jgi:hypothetical protein
VISTHHAVIPVVFLWDDDTEACRRFDDTTERRRDHASHPGPIGAVHGRPPTNLHWLSYRRERWFHDERVRG